MSGSWKRAPQELSTKFEKHWQSGGLVCLLRQAGIWVMEELTRLGDTQSHDEVNWAVYSTLIVCFHALVVIT